MKRIRPGARVAALLVLASLGSGAALLHGCVPDADISGLPPPPDAGPPIDASLADAPNDVALDVSLDHADAGETGPNEGGNGQATITGVVLDYTQGAGKGVIPNAKVSTVSLTGSVSTQTDKNGFFVLHVPAGHVVLAVSRTYNPSDPTAQIVYSTTQVVLDVTAGETVNVFPLLHEGCVGRFPNLGAGGLDAGLDTTLLTATCTRANPLASGSITKNYVEVSLSSATALLRSDGTTPFSGTARAEMIPIAFPTVGATPDLKWAVGLPGTTTIVDTIGAVEVRVVDDSTGEPLKLATGSHATIKTPISQPALTQLQGYQGWRYDALNSTWIQDTGASVQSLTERDNNNVTVGILTVSNLNSTWWSITLPNPQSDAGTGTNACFTGTIEVPGGAAAANVWVRAVGLDYVGATSAVTDTKGKFCIDVKNASHVAIAAGTTGASGTFGGIQPFPGNNQTSNGGSCEPAATGCIDLGVVTLPQMSGSCVNVNIVSGPPVDAGPDAEAGAPPVPPAIVYVEAIAPTGETTAGMVDRAYIGQSTVSGGGACAQAAPGTSFQFMDPSTGCLAPANNQPQPTIDVPASQGAGTCGGTSCFDAGAVVYGCQ
jgi:hypothetical protein